MRNEEIIAMAKEAAEAAFDAFAVEMPGPATAYDFIRQNRYESFEGSDEDAQKLWDDMRFTTYQSGIFDAEYWRRAADLVGKAEGVR